MEDGHRSADPVIPPFKEGSFSISDWTGYPDYVPRPKGPFRLLQGAEYEIARKTADRANRRIRSADPATYQDMHIHELHTVKFGGDHIDRANKMVLTPRQHYAVNDWWFRMQRELER